MDQPNFMSNLRSEMPDILNWILESQNLKAKSIQKELKIKFILEEVNKEVGQKISLQENNKFNIQNKQIYLEEENKRILV